MHRSLARHIPVLLLLGALIAGSVFLGAPAAAKDELAPQRVDVPKALIRFDDGDTVLIRWPDKDPEQVRILGIDTPEVLHLEHDIPYPQAFGYEAAGFLAGCIATADKVSLLRSPEKDPFGRTLGYLYVNDKNYSVLAVKARLAVSNVGHFGDNGLPGPAGEVEAAAKAAGPVPFEAPHRYRRRMREVSKYLKAKGLYPTLPESKDADEE